MSTSKPRTDFEGLILKRYFEIVNGHSGLESLAEEQHKNVISHSCSRKLIGCSQG